MLAQSFQSAADLGITEPQLSALQKTLVLLETGKLVHANSASDRARDATFSGRFNMANWRAQDDCGTICCIGGTAEIVGNLKFYDGEFGYMIRTPLSDLFMARGRPDHIDWHDITPDQAATALRSYLTTGDAKWHEAVA